MVRPQLRWILALVLIGTLVSTSEAQRTRREDRDREREAQQQADPNAGKPKLPEDPRLLEVHQAFVRGAEKLALEYVRKKELDKAISCYREILRLVPNHAKAQAGLAAIIGKQSSAKRVVIEIMANKGWQDSGIDVIAGKPILIRTDGHWKLNMHYPVGADGLEIPEELRKFNLGSLIGIVIPPGESPSSKIEPPKAAESGEQAAADNAGAPAEAAPAEGGAADGAATEEKPADDAAKEAAAKEEEDKKPKPFFIGHQADLFAKTSGRLYMRMYDSDATDNIGKVRVDISGTFDTVAASTGSSSSRAK